MGNEIYLNKKVNYKCYFVKTNVDEKTNYTYGYVLHNKYGLWSMGRGRFDTGELENQPEAFPLVGSIDMDNIIFEGLKDQILGKIEKLEEN